MIKVGLDYTFFLQLIQFLIIVLITSKLIVRPIRRTMEARDGKINGLLADAEAQIKSVEESRIAYEAKLKEVKGEISEYQRKVREETSGKVNEAISKAKIEIASSTSESRKELAKVVEDTRASLEKDLGELSNLIYKTISGKAA